MIIELLEVFFLSSIALTLAYLVRHYIFTLTVLRKSNKLAAVKETSENIKYDPSVTVLIPACNEEKVIGRILQRLTATAYPKNKLQVIVINDASVDKTEKIVSEYAAKYPYISVVNRNSDVGGKGKSAAMNDGFQRATGEVTLCFDADYFPPKNLLGRLVSAFADPKVGAVQGRVVVQNESKNFLTRLVALERVGGYRVDQEARDILGLITQFGGTVGGFRSGILRQLGGWDESVLAEDTDLTFRIYLAGYKIKYDVDAECYEEAVDNWGAYYRQRYRWAKGHMQCFCKHFLPVIASSKLNLKQKIDGLLLLNLYFMPIIVFFSFMVGLGLIACGTSIFNISPLVVPAFCIILPISFYSFVGNFAPFFEVGVGLYLDNRKRTQWLIPLSIVTFFYNLFICIFASLAVLREKIFRKDVLVWAKTPHSGNGDLVADGDLTLEVNSIWD